jgi:hypothetical protein
MGIPCSLLGGFLVNNDFCARRYQWILLKLYVPSNIVYADTFGLCREGRSNFSVIVACSIKQSQRCMGNQMYMLHKPARKRFFQVLYGAFCSIACMHVWRYQLKLNLILAVVFF